MFDDLFSSFKEEPWNYMYTVHYKKLKGNTFATDGHDLFMYDTDLGRYIPADDKLRKVPVERPEEEPALNAVESGAQGAQRGQE